MSIRDDFEHQLGVDEKMIAHLRSRGNVDSIRRPIDHSFWAEDRAGLDDLATLLKRLAFTDPTVKEGVAEDATRYFYLETQTVSDTQWHSIVKTSLLMSCLAAIFRVGYDGWGTLVKATEPQDQPDA